MVQLLTPRQVGWSISPASTSYAEGLSRMTRSDTCYVHLSTCVVLAPLILHPCNRRRRNYAANSCENLLKGIRVVVLLLARRVGRRRRGSLERPGTRRCKDSAYKEDRTTPFELRSEHDGDNMWDTKHKDDDEEDLGGAPAFLCCTSTADSINIITQRYNSKHDCIFQNNPGRMCVAPEW